MDAILNLDTQLFLAMNFPGGAFLDNLFYAITGKLIWVPLYLLIIYLLIRRYGWKRALVAVVCMVMAVVLVDHVANFFKHNFPKFRPIRNPEIAHLVHIFKGYNCGKYGTMSSHAAISFTVALTSLSLIRNRLYTVLILIWACAVSYSRIYLGVHFPLDILLGMFAACIFSVLAIKLYYKSISLLKL